MEEKELTEEIVFNPKQSFWERYSRRMTFRSFIRGHKSNQQKNRKQAKRLGKY